MSRVALPLLLLLAPPAAAEPPGDLPVRARAILKKHCAECHAAGGKAADLPLLDHAAVVSSARDPLPRFVARGSPDRSQVIHLVEDGSMPPGRRAKLSPEEVATLRAWVAAGAPAYPQRFDDATVLGWVAADAAALPDDDRKLVRYLSLHHAVPDDGPPPDLAAGWEAVRKALARVSVDPPHLTPVDPTGTVVRWDLRAAGWHATPFSEINIETDTPVRRSPLTVFDAVLLEYPHAAPPWDDPGWEKLRSGFLRSAGQVRPVPVVRADWLAAAVSDPRLTADLRGLLKLAGPAGPRPVPPAWFPVDPFAAGGKSAALDGFYAADPPPADPPVIAVRALDKDGKEADRFRPGDVLFPQVTATAAGRFELLWIDAAGGVFVPNLADAGRLRAGTPEVLYLGGDRAARKGFPTDPKSKPGRERFTAFFSSEPFPRGVKVRAATDAGKVERYYHPLPPGTVGDPLAGVTRTTAWFDITPAK